MNKLCNYEHFIFDCDGVVLDSNKVKTQAFYQAALPYGKTAAQALVDYHILNGGISRYTKFDYFLEKIVPKYADTTTGPSLDMLLKDYATLAKQGLLTCEIAPGLDELRKQLSETTWLIVSGGDQLELRDTFKQRNLDKQFNGGIYGSPDTKERILEREKTKGTIKKPALFLGDSKYDYQAATTAGLDFIFFYGWTEAPDWEKWVKKENIKAYKSVKELLNII